MVVLPVGRADLIKTSDGRYSAALVLAKRRRDCVKVNSAFGEALLSFQGKLAPKTDRGVWVRAILFLGMGRSSVLATGEEGGDSSQFFCS